MLRSKIELYKYLNRIITMITIHFSFFCSRSSFFVLAPPPVAYFYVRTGRINIFLMFSVVLALSLTISHKKFPRLLFVTRMLLQQAAKNHYRSWQKRHHRLPKLQHYLQPPLLVLVLIKIKYSLLLLMLTMNRATVTMITWRRSAHG